MHVEAGQAAAARGLSETRADLRDVADLDVIEAAVQTWQLEQARLVGLRRRSGWSRRRSAGAATPHGCDPTWVLV